MSARKYQAKPRLVDAIQWLPGDQWVNGVRTGGNEADVREFVPAGWLRWTPSGAPEVNVGTGWKSPAEFDWIVKDEYGNYAVLSDLEFGEWFRPSRSER